MIKLAVNRANPNLVFLIDEVVRVPLFGGIVEYYKGTLKDTSTVPDTSTENYTAQTMAFESKWAELPVDVAGTGGNNNQANKDVTPTTSAQSVTPDTGYTGLDKVTVAAVTAAIDSNIIAENIKKDVVILGVTGTYEGELPDEDSPYEDTPSE